MYVVVLCLKNESSAFLYSIHLSDRYPPIYPPICLHLCNLLYLSPNSYNTQAYSYIQYIISLFSGGNQRTHTGFRTALSV